jgi:hypothetical protein
MSDIERNKQKFYAEGFDHKEPNDLYEEESQVKKQKIYNFANLR